MNMVLPLYRYILMAAVRDRLFLSLIGVLAVVVSLSLFFGSSALVEKMDFAVGFAAFGLRLFGVVCLSLFTINYINRCFEARDIDYLLSRPIGRTGFVLTHAAAFSTIAIVAALILGGAIALLEYKSLNAGILLWWFSLGIEFVIMVNVAMFFAFVMKSSTGCSMIVLAFYLLTRLIGEILGILALPHGGKVTQFLEKIMEFISVFLPRLDLMGQTKWILYGVPSDVSAGFVLTQGIIFCALIILATAVDMKRRQF